MSETTTSSSLGTQATGDQRRSTVAMCALNSAAMLEVDANDYDHGSPDRTVEACKAIAKANRGQAALLREAANIADEMLAALVSIESLVGSFYAGQGTTAQGSRDNIEAKRLTLTMARDAIAKATADSQGSPDTRAPNNAAELVNESNPTVKD